MPPLLKYFGYSPSNTKANVNLDVLPQLIPLGRTAPTFAQYVANNALLNIKDLGAVGDGASHPLSNAYATLALAQVTYPHAVALTDEMDWAAAQLAANRANTAGGGFVRIPNGNYLGNRPVVVQRWTQVACDGQSVVSWLKTTTTTFTGTSAVAKDCAFYFDGPSPGVFAFGTGLSDLLITMTSTAANCCGVFMGNVARSQFRNVNVQGGYDGFCSTGVWMTGLTNCRGGAQANFSFNFGSTDAKTSLSLDTCYSEAAAKGFFLQQAKYFAMNACGSDYTNSGNAPGNPYGAVAQGLYTGPGVCYQFVASVGAMVGCGAEFSYGSFLTAQQGSFIAVNGGYITSHSLSITGATFQAFMAILDTDQTDNRIAIAGCGFGNAGVIRTGPGTNIVGYSVPATNLVAQILADHIDTVSGGGLVAQTVGRVSDQGEAARGTFTGITIPPKVTPWTIAWTIDTTTGAVQELTASVAATAFTINAPTGGITGRDLEITIKNTSAGALGAATWDPIFKMAAWVNPAAGFSRAITFRPNGANWVEKSRTPADIPN